MKKVIPEIFDGYDVNPIDDYPSQLFKCLSDSAFTTKKVLLKIVLLTLLVVIQFSIF